MLRALRRAEEISCADGTLRRRLRAIAPRLEPPLTDLGLALEAAELLHKQVIEFTGLLREYDQDMTPVRPPSHADIQAAFEASVEFAKRARRER